MQTAKNSAEAIFKQGANCTFSALREQVNRISNEINAAKVGVNPYFWATFALFPWREPPRLAQWWPRKETRMSYLVLARKWRPKKFTELVGQEHVVRALTNALDSGRVHHAFLFTGTRGVGKTTIARIFAKSLNCDRGESSNPCGECTACLDIDAGRFIDLLEIDAASNTGVDDVRELIDNAQYMPARGRTKVYLIDEVHMLSKNAFNALLKTLEEPPGHVKFLLATTDPQKLPVTVLSRCLQFNLRRLDQAQISGQMRKILSAEAIEYDAAAIELLARSADGSLRDGLSLLDQAIAYTGGKLNEVGVNAMLGTVDHRHVDGLLETLAVGDAAALMAKVEEMASFSPDFSHVLEDFALALHQLQCYQLIPDFEAPRPLSNIELLKSRLDAERVQLWYQMAISGRRDLTIAPSPRAGFEMTLLRMLAFRPLGDANHTTVQKPSAAQASAPSRSNAAAVSIPELAPLPVQKAAVVSEAALAKPEATHPVSHVLRHHEDWLQLIVSADLKGPARELAASAVFVGYDQHVLKLGLPEDLQHLRSEGLIAALAQKLSPVLGVAPKIMFEKAKQNMETLNDRNVRQRDEKQSDAHTAFVSHPLVSQLINQGAQLVPDSVRPID
jgi:DNA polymerase III subunit gamma/tau